MPKMFMVALLFDDNQGTSEGLHEALCKVLHEGYAYDDPEVTKHFNLDVNNVQVVGTVDNWATE